VSGVRLRHRLVGWVAGILVLSCGPSPLAMLLATFAATTKVQRAVGSLQGLEAKGGLACAGKHEGTIVSISAQRAGGDRGLEGAASWEGHCEEDRGSKMGQRGYTQSS